MLTFNESNVSPKFLGSICLSPSSQSLYISRHVIKSQVSFLRENMEEVGKSPESCFTGDLRALMELHDGENGDEFLPEVEIKEEMVVEVMQELLKEINTCCEEKTSPSPAIFPAIMPSSFVAGGDNERCGPVFSDWASTVMAGVGMEPAKKLAAEEEVVFPVGGGEEKMDGCDDDDEWLERVLSMDPQEFEWT